MTVSRLRRLAVTGAGCLAVSACLSSCGDSDYTVKLRLDNANGLRDGSPVVVGGLDAGRVELSLGPGRHSAVATLRFRDKSRRIGRDARAVISSLNLLGQKRVELDPGTSGTPAPAGFQLPASQVRAGTDLDQVLNVLDANTRGRLAVLINESGRAFGGRRADLSALLRELPPSFADVTRLANALVTDNHTLANLVTRGDRVVASLSRQRRQLGGLLRSVADASTTVAARRAALRETLAQAPGAVRTLRGFLADLERTTVPLGPAARDVAATAPPLADTLSAVSGFTRAAQPTLATATKVAPDLSRFAVGATPVVRRAAPVAGSLADFSSALSPVSAMLNKSAFNLAGLVDNWARAIQLRDGMSHIFRGQVSFAPNMFTTLLDRLVDAPRKKAKKGATPSRGGTQEQVQRPPTKAPAEHPNAKPALPAPVQRTIDKVTGIVGGLLGGPGQDSGKSDGPAGKSLLDYLLGP